MAMVATKENDLVAVIEAYNDVTERLKQSHEVLGREVYRLREALHEKNKELARHERLAALGQMAAGLAHEIRNPLGGIGLYSSLLEKDLADRPKQQRIARSIGEGVSNLDKLVTDILSFARGAEPNRQWHRLAQVLDSVSVQAAPQLRAKDVVLDIDSVLYDVKVYVDVAQLERALMNLLFNAVDAVGHGGRVWIRHQAEAEKSSHVSLVIEDDGPGISPDLLHRVFDPFFTTKDKGTGLGLAIVHRIIESNGGSIVARARTQGGASFHIDLPTSDENAQRLGLEE